jgi:signal transduction histidine kinase
MELEQHETPADKNEPKNESVKSRPARTMQDLWINKPAEALAEDKSYLLSIGLKYAIKDYCQVIPKTHFLAYGIQPSLDAKFITLFYRCACELIDNARIHAQAQNIWIQLDTCDDYLSLTVQDDGVGFDPRQTTAFSGLAHIIQTVEALKGRMYIDSTPGLETNVTIEIEKPQKRSDV